MSTPSLKVQLTTAMKDAMRSKQKERLSTIRLALSALKQIEVDERIELDDTRVITILDKLIKQRRESIKQYEAANRPELAAIEAAEIEVLKDFLPQQLTHDELDSLIQDTIQQVSAESIKDMGKVMGLLKPKLLGRADMGSVGQMIKQKLG